MTAEHLTRESGPVGDVLNPPEHPYIKCLDLKYNILMHTKV